MGAGTVEYTAVVVGVLLLAGAVVAAFPSLGPRIACSLSNVFTTVTGGDATGCAGSGQSQAGGDTTSLPPQLSVSVPERTTAGSGSVGVRVEVNDGVTYTVTSDQPWAVPYGDWGEGTGTASVLFHSNAGGERQATLTVKSSDGKTKKVTVTQPGQTQTYVAWGDSYSAGVGTDPSTSGSSDYDVSERRSRWGPVPDAWNEDDCFRAADSWTRQLGDGRQSAAAGTPSLALSDDSFLACSGATWDGTTVTGGAGAPSVKDQMDATDSSAAVVTLTVGGNDIGFADIVTNCVNPVSGGIAWNVNPYSAGSQTAERYVEACGNGIADGRRSVAEDLGPRLTEVYEHALKSAPNATIYVVGYPPVVEADDINHTWSIGQIPPANISGAVQLLTDLNDKIRKTVDEVNANSDSGPRLVYVDPTAPDSPFTGHSVGDQDSYINGIRLHTELGLNPIPSYHPNKNGNDAYAQIVARYIMGDYGD
ncbi:MAG: GDSL-type esterase/lipase family protein [Cellulomonas sp.]|jgi:lysophospholipase L1-like esterase|nr:GDSL-type esterase/lipase family protein [Cellulomonas sp.]